MASPADDLESAVLALPAAERARLAERLLASLAEDVEVEEAWAEEIRRRLEACRNGQIESVPARQVIEELRARLDR
jgi:putative addiction module component (TIGR02574 family)